MRDGGNDIVAIIVFLIAGAIAGTLSGLFGLGGGLIVVPTLVFLFDYTYNFSGNVMQIAQGTSLAVMVITTFSSAFSHLRRGNVLFPLLRRLLAGVMIGVFLGALAAHFVASFWLRILFGCFLLVISALMFYMVYVAGKRDAPLPAVMPSVTIANISYLFIGFCSGLLGIGAGSLSTPFLSRYHFPMKNIAAVSAVCSFPIAVIGAVTYLLLGLHKVYQPWTTGYINWKAFFFIAITSFIFAPLGARLATHLNSLMLKRIFAVILLLLALQMFYSAL